MLPRIPLLILAAFAAGCSTAPEVREQSAPAPAQPSIEMIQGAQITRYLVALQTMVQGSPTEKAEVMKRARDGYEGAKQGPAALFYALLLAAPGHPDRDLALARRLLSDTTAYPQLLTIPERALATVELQRVNEELRLTTEIERLVAEAQQERERQRNAPNAPALIRRLQEKTDEAASLRKQLEEAKTKLADIAELERRLSERQPPTDGRKP
jgi:hypothetical protein